MIPYAKTLTLDVSVIIPVYNAEKTLKACLDSVLAFDFPAERREIIVVDNHSTDASADIMKSYPVRYLFEANRGRAWARNCGIKEARGEYIVFIDADCIAQRDCLKVLFEHIRHNENLAACGGKVIALSQKTIFEKYEEEKKLLSQEIGIKGRYEWDLPRVVTANAIFRKKIFDEIGYFDEDLVTNEDTELSWRISFLGYWIDYVPGAKVFHQHRSSLRHFCRHHFEYGWATTIFKYKYRKLKYNFKEQHSWLYRICYATGILFFCFFYVLRDHIRALGDYAGRKQFSFILTDMIHRSCFYAGLYCAWVWLLFYHAHIGPYKGLGKDQYLETLEIANHSVRWDLQIPVSWFFKDEKVRILVFSQFLEVFHLNKTASVIWVDLVKTKDYDSAIDHLTKRFDIPKTQAQEDVDCFIESLVDSRILKRETYCAS